MIRVLLVDDSRLTHEYLKEVLSGQGFLVSGHAYNGLEAIRVYNETTPDVVVMDVMMPKLDGIGAIKEIRSLDPDARIVVLTSVEEVGVLNAAIEAGARDYSLKPCDPHQLVEALRRATLGRATQNRGRLRLSHALIDVIAEVLPDYGGIQALHAIGGGPWVRRIQNPMAFKVAFSGAYRGALNFFFEPNFGRAIVERLAPDLVDDLEMQEDALSELGNLITGRVARFLESVHGTFEFYPPEAIDNSEPIANSPPICRVATDAGLLEITLTQFKD